MDERSFARHGRSAWRSALFVPGDDGRKLERAGLRGADAVIVDLEDGVGPASKQAARQKLVAHAARLQASGCHVAVRINADWRTAFADLQAAAAAKVGTIVVPKVVDAMRTRVIRQILIECQAVGESRIGLLPLIESPAALSNLDQIAAGDDVIGLALGSEDYSLELGVEPGVHGLDLPCKLIAAAAAAHGRMALAVPISIAVFDDAAALRDAYMCAKQAGSTGALCIHPAQVAIANTIFSPADTDLAKASMIVEAWSAARARGEAVVVVAGRMVDAPVVARAQRLLGLN